MISIDESFVTAAAPNPDAAKNGRALVLKKQYSELGISSDQTIIFGMCQGSGRGQYLCSSDFANAEAATHRCSCPSRQFPCKHCLGLMFAYVQDPTQFQVASVPEDLQAKRDKVVARAEKRQANADKPRNVNKGALAKKIRTQLEGLDLLERLTHHLISIGIGNMNAKLASEIETQARQLGDAYLPGAQFALRAYTQLFANSTEEPNDNLPPSSFEAIYGEALDRLSTLYAMIKQGRIYLEKRLADPELKPDTESSIAAWLGHAWQLSELRSAGQMIAQVELMQLVFNSHDDAARKEWVDTGIWIDLSRGTIYSTKNYRPYKAARFVKTEDSFYQVAQITELFVYPGDMNPRVRWDGMTSRSPEEKDFAAIRQAAATDIELLVKQIKGNLKGPLSEKQPVGLLKYRRIGIQGETFVVEDELGHRLTMTDRGMAEEPPSLQLLRLVPTELLRDQILVIRFRHDLDTCSLQVKPLGIVSDKGIVRLTL